MMLVIGASSGLPVAVAMLVLTAGTAAVLVRVLRSQARGEHEDREPGHPHHGLQP
jgi:hypothetical protein